MKLLLWSICSFFPYFSFFFLVALLSSSYRPSTHLHSRPNALLHTQQGECVPNFSELRELGDLSDGVCLVGLLAFYAPDVVDWTRMATNEPFSMADCLYNLELVQKFCSESLATNIFHLGLEDIVYMHRYLNQIFQLWENVLFDCLVTG